ncbi:MAG: hypothetical protein V4503_10985 [Gemmatimonadota bacterium]
MRRPHRWLAALLLIASPPLGGQALAVLHPCPATTPVIAAHQHGGHEQSGHQHDASQHCTCLGSCHLPAVASSPDPLVRTLALVAPVRAPLWRAVESDIPAAAALYRLPPKTAPPLA